MKHKDTIRETLHDEEIKMNETDKKSQEEQQNSS